MAACRSDERPVRGKTGWQRAGMTVTLLIILLGLSIPVPAQDNQHVLKAFENQAEKKEQLNDTLAISTKEKQKILFFMGISLLIGLLATAGLGIAMGVYGKPVFVAHMLFAGLSVTLAVIHAIVAMVWFFPF